MTQTEKSQLIALLELILQKKSLFGSGLCCQVQRLYIRKLVSYSQWELFEAEIRNHAPIAKPNSGGYCWKRGSWKVRENWINKRIKCLQNEEQDATKQSMVSNS